MNTSKSQGKVYICGAGPGNEKLLTLRAFELINKIEVILYDRLVGDEITKLFPPTSEKIYVGRGIGDPSTHQDKTNEIMIKYVKDGKDVLRLKGGDPFIFGRGGEEAEFLKQNDIEYEIIPGVTSATGAASYSGIPLTHRKYASSVVFVTGHEDPKKKTPIVHWEKLIATVDTIVIYMGTEKLEQVINKIKKGISLNQTLPVAIIENGTLKTQRVVIGNLNNIIEKAHNFKIKPPSIIVIGEVVNLNSIIGWNTQ